MGFFFGGKGKFLVLLNFISFYFRVLAHASHRKICLSLSKRGNMIEYDRINNSCFDDRQEVQIISSKCTQQKKPRSSPRSSKMGQPSNQENRVICQSQKIIY